MTSLRSRRSQLPAPGICKPPPDPPLPPDTPVIDRWIRPRINPLFPGQTTIVDVHCERLGWEDDPTITLQHLAVPPAYTGPAGMIDGIDVDATFHAQSGVGDYLLTTTFTYVDDVSVSASASMTVVPPG